MAGSADKPQLILELILEVLQDGQSIARGQIDLPAPDKQGKIPYIAKLPLDNFKTAGIYEIRVIARQGQQVVEEHAFFTMGQ